MTALLGKGFRKLGQEAVPEGVWSELPPGTYFSGKIDSQLVLVYLSGGHHWAIAVRTAREVTGPARTDLLAKIRATFGYVPEDFDKSAPELLSITSLMDEWIRGELV